MPLKSPDTFGSLTPLVPLKSPDTFGSLTPLVPTRRSSQYGDQLDGDEIILVDTIGELRHFWGLATIATVGGTFGVRGGQSMIEPAGFGCAVSFGPDTRNFRVIAEQMLDAGGAVRVAGQHDLERFVIDCLENPAAADDRGRAAAAFVAEHAGALERTMTLLGLAAKRRAAA